MREAIVLPVLRGLGWDDLDPERVIREHRLGDRRVDYALAALGKQPAIFIEVKGPGAALGGERQLFEYAFHAGIPFAVLTNGQEWSFFLPAAPGSYEERLLYKLDLTERETDEAAGRLERYLGFGHVRSGEALRAARQDYDDIHNRRIVREEMPRAWSDILAEPDIVLVDLLTERVATLCGFPPAQETVVAFLTGLAAGPARRTRTEKPQRSRDAPPGSPMGSVAERASPPLEVRPIDAVRAVEAVPSVAEPVHAGGLAYTFEGQARTARSASEIMLHVVRTLARRDAGFCERFAAAAAGRRRNHVARRPEDVYPGQPQLLKAVVEIIPGWYIGTNVANRDKVRLLQAACRVAGLEFGTDLVVTLPNATASSSLPS